MNEMASVSARRREIELNIEIHRDAAAGNLLAVGRWLNAAKDENVVPHGAWTEWVGEHAALGERTAQLWMQAARELPEGSTLAALGTAKLRSLMALPSGEREAFAERIGADKLTSREVDAQVKAARAERDEALRLVGEQKKKLKDAAAQAEQRIDQAIRTAREAAEKGAREREERLRREAEALRASLLASESERAALQAERSERPAAPDLAQQAQMEALKRQLADRERELDRLSEALDEAQTAAMRGGMSGESEKTSPVTMILSAIGALMAQAGRAPAELARVQGLDEETRRLVAGQARMTGQWAMQVLAACGEGDGHV